MVKVNYWIFITLSKINVLWSCLSILRVINLNKYSVLAVIFALFATVKL